MTGKYQDWTIKEIKLLEKLYLKNDLTRIDLIPYFPNRTPTAIKRALDRYNLWRKELEAWKQEELNFLIENYHKIGCLKCAKHLKRTKWMIKQQARRLNLKTDYEYWTNEEIEILKQNYKVQPLKNILSLLNNKSLVQITNKMKKLGLKRTEKPADKRAPWTEIEIKLLKENYSSKTKEEIIQLIPTRNYSQITKKASNLKLKKCPLILGFRSIPSGT